MNTSEPPHRHHDGRDPLLPPTRLPLSDAPPASGWLTLTVAERLIQALERLIDLNEDTARITALYRAHLQQQRQPSAARREADTRRAPKHDRVQLEARRASPGALTTSA